MGKETLNPVVVVRGRERGGFRDKGPLQREGNTEQQGVQEREGGFGEP